MKLASTKKDYTRYQKKEHDFKFDFNSYGSRGDSAKVSFSIDNREYDLLMTVDETKKLIAHLQKAADFASK